MLLTLEMWIRESKENGAELRLVEEVGKKFHGIGTEYGDVLIRACSGWCV